MSEPRESAAQRDQHDARDAPDVGRAARSDPERSGQRDTKANELFHALVLLVYEAMDEIDTHSIPKRGWWGTPTARAYPLELKNSFLKALLTKYAERGGDTIELRYPVGSAA